MGGCGCGIWVWVWDMGVGVSGVEDGDEGLYQK